MGRNFSITAESQICAKKLIHIGENVLMSWQCLLIQRYLKEQLFLKDVLLEPIAMLLVALLKKIVLSLVIRLEL